MRVCRNIKYDTIKQRQIIFPLIGKKGIKRIRRRGNVQGRRHRNGSQMHEIHNQRGLSVAAVPYPKTGLLGDVCLTVALLTGYSRYRSEKTLPPKVSGEYLDAVFLRMFGSRGPEARSPCTARARRRRSRQRSLATTSIRTSVSSRMRR